MSSNHVVLSFTISALAFLAVLPVAVAQTTGSIQGTVTDPSGAPVPEASVKITQRQTGVVISSKTNATGYYLAENLDPGSYDISVNRAGFKTYQVQNIILDIATQVRRDVTLTIGNLSDSVTVQADAVEVQTSSGTVETVITRDQIGTAVLNGRNYERLAMLVPGAVYNSSSDELYNAGLNAPGSPVSINGLSSLSSGWFVDGAYDVNVGNGNANTHVPVIDAIEELQVQTSNYSAKYGTTGGSVINAVTRSGTKLFHGSAYEYFRNSAMDARNFFSPTVSPVKQNQYGFTFGGPVILPHYNHDRNKTFFFYSEDWRNRSTPSVAVTATPTPAMRAGDFSAESARIGLPILDPNTKAPFPNNQIPTSRVDPNAALLLSTYFPLPNYSAQGTFNNYINNGAAVLKPRTDTGRLDHNLNDNIRLSFVISHDNINVLQSNIAEGAFNFPNIRQQEDTTGYDGQILANITISPVTTNEASFAFKRYDVNLLMVDDGAPQVRPSGLTIKDFFPSANTLDDAPGLTFSGGWSSAGTSQLPLSPATDNNNILSDNFTHIMGKHTLQAGGTWFHYVKTQAIFNTTQGTYSFTGTFTNDPIADFMLGLAKTYTQTENRFTRTYLLNQTEWYGQDDWRASRRLTLNLGLRVFFMPPVHEAQNRVDNFIPSLFNPANAPIITSAGVLTPTPTYSPTNGLVMAGQNGVPNGLANNFIGIAPRFGFAFDPVGNGKMAIRGGYGISYNNVGNDLNADALNTNPPFSQNVSLQNVSLSDPSNGIPNALAPVSLGAFSPEFKRPMVHSWSVMVQRELPGQFLVSAGYVGTRSTNNETWVNINSPAFVPPAGYQFDPRINAGMNTNLLAPYQGYAAITDVESGLNSIYNSLQTTFQRRFLHGLALQGSYTYSKVLGEILTARNVTTQNPTNWLADYGPADFDRTHVFTMNYVYTLPVLRARHDIVGQLFGNWQLSGFITAQSGLAMSPGISTGKQGLATRPNATGESIAGPQTIAEWFNTAAFAAPAAGFYGNSGIGVIRGPGFGIWDASPSKQFPIYERLKFRLGGEFFNAINHTNFSGITTTLGSGTYGRVTSARDPRKVQLNARLEF
jgi:hypothetical protein